MSDESEEAWERDSSGHYRASLGARCALLQHAGGLGRFNVLGFSSAGVLSAAWFGTDSLASEHEAVSVAKWFLHHPEEFDEQSASNH